MKHFTLRKRNYAHKVRSECSKAETRLINGNKLLLFMLLILVFSVQTNKSIILLRNER